MGFSKEQGRKAALAGIAAKREFEEAQAEIGQEDNGSAQEESGKLGCGDFCSLLHVAGLGC
jgi:hypothetical protein